LYISEENRGEDDPIASLRGFQRVFLPAGKAKTVEFDLFSANFETVNAHGENVLVPGSYKVIAADSAPVPVSVEKGAPAPVSEKIMIN
jgi:hypothetical protein